MSSIARVTARAAAGIVTLAVGVGLATGVVATMHTTATPVGNAAVQAADTALVVSSFDPNNRHGGGLIFSGIGPQRYPTYLTPQQRADIAEAEQAQGDTASAQAALDRANDQVAAARAAVTAILQNQRDAYNKTQFTK